MIAWQTGYQDAEREYQNMNETLLQEVLICSPLYVSVAYVWDIVGHILLSGVYL